MPETTTQTEVTNATCQIIKAIADNTPKQIAKTRKSTKGIKNPLKRPHNQNGGRKPIFDNIPEDINKVQQIIDDFCALPQEEQTVCDLAISLNIARNTLLEYIARGNVISNIIKKGYTYCERKYERKLSSQQYGGAIFALKNMGWRDIQETNGGVMINIVPK